MKKRWLVAAMLCVAACRKDNRAEQLAALDNAYQAGVISKAEYEAKRQALGASAPVAAPALAPAPSPSPSVKSEPPRVLETAKPAAAPAPRKEVNDKPSPLAPLPKPEGVLPAVPPPQVTPTPTPPPPAPAAQREAEPRTSAGCEEVESEPGKEKGSRQHFYPAPLDAVRAAAREAMASLDFNIHTDSASEMEASKRKHIGAIVGAGGERLILRFERSRSRQTGTMVTAETKKSFVGHVSQKSWTNAILAQIACHLRAGR